MAAMLQRAPKDAGPPKDTSQAALNQTVAGVGTPPPSPVAVADTVQGTGTPPPSQAHLVGRAVPVDDAEVRAAFAKNPSSVVRSPHPAWHAQIYVLDQGTGGIPSAYRSGKYIFVTPDEPRLPATDLPSHGPTDVIDLKPQQKAAPPPPPEATVSKDAATAGGGSTTGVGRTGPRKAPEGRPSQHLAHTPARPATDDEVAAAYKANPQSVYRSNTHDWHEQIYDLDKGPGEEYPRAFKSGNVYIVSPDYKGGATPIPDHLGEDPTHGPKGGGPAGGASGATPTTTGATSAKAVPAPSPPQAASTVNIPGATYDESSKGKAYSSTVTQDASGTTQIRDRKRELGMVTHGKETTDGELSNRKETRKGVALGEGGNLIGGAYGATGTSKAGDDLSATKATQLNAGITADGKLAIGGQKSKELVYGTKPDGTPLTKSSAVNAGVTVDPNGGIGGQAGYTRTGPGGTQTSVGGGFTDDGKGNSSLSGNAGMTSKGGHGVSVSVSSGHTVTADEPEEVAEGVWAVRYVVSDTESVGAGGTVKAPGGVGVGLSGSVSDAANQTGTRRFSSEKDAKAFKDNAAERIVRDGSLGYFPINTVVGALAIPVGEARGFGSSHTEAGSASVTFGATVGKSGQQTTGGETSVLHVGANTVHVTATVTANEGSDWSISGGLSNDKGGSEGTLYAVTYEFDLGNPEGQRAFESFATVPLPPMSGGKRVSVRTLETQEDHDNYKLLGGSASWTGTAWQEKTEDQQGTHEKYGGKQSHDADPGRFWKFLGDEEEHSNAQIVRGQENDVDAGARAEFTVSGESGEFNRQEFGKVFMGAKHAGTAKASGSWTLSAEVSKERMAELEKVSPRLRAATGMDEKMKVYSELVKENGAQMLGGQVGMTSSAWSLELKGDVNFPGQKGRDRLNALRKTLAEQLKKSPETAGAAIAQANEELEKLAKRREAVADTKRYTDLPEGLRTQQLGVIDKHIEDMQTVRRTAQAVAMKQDPADRGATGANDRLKKDGYDLEHKKADREYAKLQDLVQSSETKIFQLRNDVREQSRALGDAIGSKGSTALKFHVDSAVAQVHIGLAKSWIAQATAADKEQAALDARIDALRNAWTDAKDQPARLAAIKELNDVLAQRVKLMERCISHIREAGKAVFPIATTRAMSFHPEFWLSLGMVADEPADAPTRTSMAL